MVEFDIRRFFDSVPWALMVKAVQAHSDAPWVLLYVKRWLAAPMQQPDGTLLARDRGSPQGSAISPVLANLFMHYAFDTRLARKFPAVRFERFADDGVVHCATEYQARQVLAALTERMVQVGLELHPDKTGVVYCKDGKRRGAYDRTEFTFLGFIFRPRGALGKNGKMFLSFLPATSKDALKKMSATVHAWRLHRRTGSTESDLARMINPVVRGWMAYYGAFYRSALTPLLGRINAYLMRWSRNKYERLRGRKRAHEAWSRAVKLRQGSSLTRPGSTPSPPSDDQNDKSRINREVYVRICGSPELQRSGLPGHRAAGTPLTSWRGGACRSWPTTAAWWCPNSSETPSGMPCPVGMRQCCPLVLKRFSDVVRVEVWDPSLDVDVRPREADLLSESGRGLAIVTALCGSPPLVFAVPGAGKTVVAVIPRTA